MKICVALVLLCLLFTLKLIIYSVAITTSRTEVQITWPKSGRNDADFANTLQLCSAIFCVKRKARIEFYNNCAKYC